MLSVHLASIVLCIQNCLSNNYLMRPFSNRCVLPVKRLLFLRTYLLAAKSYECMCLITSIYSLHDWVNDGQKFLEIGGNFKPSWCYSMIILTRYRSILWGSSSTIDNLHVRANTSQAHAIVDTCTKVYSHQKNNAKGTEYTIHIGCALNRDSYSYFEDWSCTRKQEGMRLPAMEGTHCVLSISL